MEKQEIGHQLERLPFMTASEFNLACDALLSRSQHMASHSSIIMTSVKGTDHTQYLKILQRITIDSPQQTEMQSKIIDAEQEEGLLEDSIDDDDDDEAVISQYRPALHTISVEYNVVLSPAYQVPVLYFFLRDLPPGVPCDIDTVYQHLVPKQSHESLHAIGTIGGISMVNHPFIDLPCFTVHPCNTADAMQEIIGARQFSGLNYLLVWAGLMGSCVGLYLPKELAIDYET